MLIGSAGPSSFTLTPTLSRTQFTLYAVVGAPLLMGASLQRGLSTHDLQTYSNKILIAANQQPRPMAPILQFDSWLGLGLIVGRAVVLDRSVLVKRADGVRSDGVVNAKEIPALALAFANHLPWARTLTCNTNCWETLAGTFQSEGERAKFQRGACVRTIDVWEDEGGPRSMFGFGPDIGSSRLAGRKHRVGEDFSVEVEGWGGSRGIVFLSCACAEANTGTRQKGGEYSRSTETKELAGMSGQFFETVFA